MGKLLLRWFLTTGAVLALIFLVAKVPLDWKVTLIAVLISTLIVVGDLGEYHVYY